MRNRDEINGSLKRRIIEAASEKAKKDFYCILLLLLCGRMEWWSWSSRGRRREKASLTHTHSDGGKHYRAQIFLNERILCVFIRNYRNALLYLYEIRRVGSSKPRLFTLSRIMNPYYFVINREFECKKPFGLKLRNRRPRILLFPFNLLFH